MADSTKDPSSPGDESGKAKLPKTPTKPAPSLQQVPPSDPDALAKKKAALRKEENRPPTKEEIFRTLEAGWTLAPLHQYDRSLLPYPPGVTPPGSPSKSLNSTLKASPPSKSHSPQSSRLPPLPSPRRQQSPAPSSEATAVPAKNTELNVAKQLAQSWVRGKSRGDDKAFATVSPRTIEAPVVHPFASSLIVGLGGQAAASEPATSDATTHSIETKHVFRIPFVSGSLFEGKSGYAPVPEYQERIKMAGKLGSPPYRVDSSPPSSRKAKRSPHK